MTGIEILSLVGSNPGAMRFVSQMGSRSDTEEMIEKIRDLPSLRGTNIYVLCSDICGGDLDLVHHLLDAVPREELEQACSKQDFSGKYLVQKYPIQEV